MREKKNIHEFAVTFFYLLLGAFGVCGVFLSAARPSFLAGEYAAGLAAFCAFTAYVLVRCSAGGALSIFAGLAVPCLLAWVWQAERLTAGLTNGAQELFTYVNERFQINLVIPVRPEYGSSDTTLALLMASLPVVLLLGYAVYYRGTLLLSFCFLAPIVVTLCLDCLPGLFFPVMTLLCFGGVQAGGRKRRQGGGIDMGAAAGSALLIGITSVMACLLVMPLLERLDAHYRGIGAGIQQAVNEDVLPAITRAFQKSPFFSAGPANGELNQEGGFQYVGAEILEITTDRKPSGDIYLKGFIGDTYTGDFWAAEEEGRLAAYYNDNGWEAPADGRELVNLSYYAAEAGSRVYPIRTHEIEVRRIAASDRYELVPYGVWLMEDRSVQPDGTVYGEKSPVSSYAYYPIQDYYWMRPEYEAVLEEPHRSAELSYRQYVYDNYLDYPRGRLPGLEELCSESIGTGKWGAVFFVTDYLKQAARYNISTPVFPDGKDFIEYFLFEQKEGYCVHFASAAVLMLRMLEVPARYVSGYCVPASSFEKQADGSYKAVVKDRQAHAWAEVYLDGIGWIPVESTPGGGGAGITDFLAGQEERLLNQGFDNLQTAGKDETQKQPEAAVGEEERKEKQMQEQENLQDGTLDTTGSSDRDAGRYVSAAMLLLLCAMAAGIIVLLANRAIRRGRRRKRFAQPDSRERIRNIFLEMYAVLLDAGVYGVDDVSSREFLEAVPEWCTDMEPECFMRFMKEVAQCNFGCREPGEDDVRLALELYEKVCRQLRRESGRGRRLWFYFGKGYF